VDKTLKQDKATHLGLFCGKSPAGAKRPPEPFPLLLVGTREGGVSTLSQLRQSTPQL